MAFELPKLPYDYKALEPHIDAQTMEIHYTKHHQGYVDKVNAALQDHANFQNKSIQDVLRSLEELPDAIVTAVRNNGGGHANHSLFWTIMSPDGGGEPQGKLMEALQSEFDSFSNFQDQFSQVASTHFGSGWAWLVVNDQLELEVMSTLNQDSPYILDYTPILGLDVWEHAYYLKYQNKRADYIAQWWNVVNWDQVNQNYLQATSS